jgi:hypothetical protein
MANVVIEEGQFNRMLSRAGGALKEWNARRPVGEADAIQVYREGNKVDGALGVLGANAAMLQPVLAGAVIYAVVTSDYFNKLELLKAHWSLKALLVMALGYYLFRKQSPWAQAVLAAGAILFVKAWKERPEKAKEAAGPDDEDAGRWEWDRRDDGREREDERRHHVLSGHRATHNAERLADRIFEHARAA